MYYFTNYELGAVSRWQQIHPLRLFGLRFTLEEHLPAVPLGPVLRQCVLVDLKHAWRTNLRGWDTVQSLWRAIQGARGQLANFASISSIKSLAGRKTEEGIGKILLRALHSKVWPGRPARRGNRDPESADRRLQAQAPRAQFVLDLTITIYLFVLVLFAD